LAEQTEKDLLEQAKKIQEEANKKAKELKEKAKKLRQKNLAKFGELAIKFLKNEIEKDELKSFAINQKFIKEEEN
jgi:hypothetical protein